MNIYLDIDGVILANEKTPALHVHEFLEYVTNNHSCFWLTTHCRGDAQGTLAHLANVLPPDTLKLLKDVRATTWDVNKTEAIDFSRPFLWFDDDLFPEEMEELIAQDALKSWVEVDLARDHEQLQKLTDWLAAMHRPR